MEKKLFQLKEKLTQIGQVKIKIRVKPGAKKDEIIGEMADGSLKIAVAAAPEKGRANARLASFLASEFGVKIHNVEIASGQTAKVKLIKITR